MFDEIIENYYQRFDTAAEENQEKELKFMNKIQPDENIDVASFEKDSLLRDLMKRTHEVFPRGSHMASGYLQGEVLKDLVRLLRAKSILDIGTFTGYSALCFASALKETESHATQYTRKSRVITLFNKHAIFTIVKYFTWSALAVGTYDF